MKKIVLLLILCGGLQLNAESLSPFQIYDLTSAITTKNFYDPTFRGLPWPQMVAQYRRKVSERSTPSETASVIQNLLKNLKASHTEFVMADQQEYHGLQSIFSGDIEGDSYLQAGGWYQNIEGQWFVRSLFVDSPLAKAGVMVGDEILSVDGKPLAEVNSFLKYSPVEIHFLHEPNGLEQVATLTPEKKSVQEYLLASTMASKKILSVAGKRVGYFHLWSGTHDRFLGSILSTTQEMADATDVLILDLRDGYGGAWTHYVQPFFDHDLETGEPTAQIYKKPVYVLINDGVRSGKEYLAFLMKREKRAVLVGTNTAGHFLGGNIFQIENGVSALYLAIHGDPTGQLEGRGVAPDIEVPSALPYSQGKDAQLETVLALIQKSN
jgi:carboxyl-terminal processing protease